MIHRHIDQAGITTINSYKMPLIAQSASQGLYPGRFMILHYHHIDLSIDSCPLTADSSEYFVYSYLMDSTQIASWHMFQVICHNIRIKMSSIFIHLVHNDHFVSTFPIGCQCPLNAVCDSSGEHVLRPLTLESSHTMVDLSINSGLGSSQENWSSLYSESYDHFLSDKAAHPPELCDILSAIV